MRNSESNNTTIDECLDIYIEIRTLQCINVLIYVRREYMFRYIYGFRRACVIAQAATLSPICMDTYRYIS